MPTASHILDTASGARLDLDSPSADQICLGDIASALSKICRFGAQASSFYSVAQHALLVSGLVAEEFGRPDLGLYALHHDSHEAYVCDMPRPLKEKLRDDGNRIYDEVSDLLDAAISDAMGFKIPLADSDQRRLIKLADDRALIAEADRLIHDKGAGIRLELESRGRAISELEPLPVIDAFLDPSTAEQAFVDRDRELRTG